MSINEHAALQQEVCAKENQMIQIFSYYQQSISPLQAWEEES